MNIARFFYSVELCYCVIDMIRLTETKINAELAKIDEWLKINKLSLNLKKSKYMVLKKNKHNKYKLNTNN